MTPVPVLVAVTGAPWESQFIAALNGTPSGLTVLRRCVDLADLLAAGATATAAAALIWPDQRRLDKEALRRLADGGVAVVAVATPGSSIDEEIARSLGIAHIVSADAPPGDTVATVAQAIGRLGADRHGEPAPPPASDEGTGASGPSRPEADGEAGAERPRGRLIAVWGPTGAPGRTTVAIGVASELARAGVETMLADADTYGGAVGPMLGMVVEVPGLVTVSRLAGNGLLDLGQLADTARTIGPHLRVLTGLLRADRWAQLRPSPLEDVWRLCRELCAVTVIDTGFCTEQDEDLVFDTQATRRNGATLTTLECADVVIVVGSADPVGMIRLLQALDDLRDLAPTSTVRVVVNRVRRPTVGINARRQVADLVSKHAGTRPYACIPYDRDALDAASAAARPLGEVSPSSPARAALRDLAARLVNTDTGVRQRRRIRSMRYGQGTGRRRERQ
jgi:MinD-like ATPase involved in chromosome partitioning or flagellar assembly